MRKAMKKEDDIIEREGAGASAPLALCLEKGDKEV
jgi:hypothetical protein